MGIQAYAKRITSEQLADLQRDPADKLSVMQTSSFIQTARKVFEFLITDFGASCSEDPNSGVGELVRYDWDFIYFQVSKGRGEIDSYFRVKDKDFRYWYMMFDLMEISQYLHYLNDSNQPPKPKTTSPLTRALRQAQTEEERDEIRLRMLKQSVERHCVPIIQGDLTILELVAIDRNERAT